MFKLMVLFCIVLFRAPFVVLERNNATPHSVIVFVAAVRSVAPGEKTLSRIVKPWMVI